MAKRIHWSLVIAILVSALAPALVATAQGSSNTHFNNTWQRTDQPVYSGQVSRTWMWGPEAFTGIMKEQYTQGPDGERDVQYFDKSRMEITNPAGDSSSIWYVTNGLLVVEMTSGRMQTGDNDFTQRQPASVNVAGDADDPTGPTYVTIAGNISSGGDRTAGQTINQVIDRNGHNAARSSEMQGQLSGYGVTEGPFSPQTGKHTASVFWEFMTSNALVYQNGGYVNAPLFIEPYYATGLPIDHAWWAEVRVGGTLTWVLIQCFERRCLTYNPANPAGWQVEAGNVGRHYHAWRYGDGQVMPPPAESISEWIYVGAVWQLDRQLFFYLEKLDELWQELDFNDPEWEEETRDILMFLQDLQYVGDYLVPPARYATVHQELLTAVEVFADGVSRMEQGLNNQSGLMFEIGLDTFESGFDVLFNVLDALDELPPQLDEEEYLDWAWNTGDVLYESRQYLYSEEWEKIAAFDQETLANLKFATDLWFEMGWITEYILPPTAYASEHAQLRAAMLLVEEASEHFVSGINNQNLTLLQLGRTTFDQAWQTVADLYNDLPRQPEN